MMQELNFFFGLQIKKSATGTTIIQQKYIHELPKRFHVDDANPIDTAIGTSSKLDLDEPGSSVNETMYREIIGSLLYLTASRLDIVFTVGMCVRI